MASINQINENNVSIKWTKPLQIFTTTILTLIFPLSFLLLARISTVDYLLSVNDFRAAKPPSTVFFSLILGSIPLISPLPILVSLLSVACLVHTLTGGRIAFLTFSISPETTLRPRLYTAWIVLCTLQVCVGLGIEGSIGAGIEGSSFGHQTNLIHKIMFFLGLHATTLYWWRTIVKPVVDDTMFGFEMEEMWVERVVMGCCLGGLWWWRLRDEVESLVAVVEMKREMMVGVGVVDLMGWFIYYLVVTVGVVKVVKFVVWFGVVLCCQKVERVSDGDDHLKVQQKV